jgi:acyl-CoA dehydrogenase
MSEDMAIGEILADQLGRLFTTHLERPMRHSVEKSGMLPHSLWEEIEQLGVTLAMIGESAGGAALTWAQVEPVFRKLGAHAAPLPLGETMLAAWALHAAGLEVPAGPITLSTAVCDLQPDGGVTGSDSLVPWHDAGRSLLVVARGVGGMRLCLVAASQVNWRTLTTYGRIPSAAMQLKSVQPVASAPLPEAFGMLGLLPAVAVLRSVQTAGALDHVLSLCVDYANNRVQFGKPIGRFQAVQQLLAELAGHVAAADVAGLYACRQMDSGDRIRGAAIGKVRVALSATRGAAIAHQVFGAIGITDEHELHYYTRRLWQWRSEGGSEHSWSERLGKDIQSAGGAALWTSLTDGAAVRSG